MTGLPWPDLRLGAYYAAVKRARFYSISASVLLKPCMLGDEVPPKPQESSSNSQTGSPLQARPRSGKADTILQRQGF
ncbi:hypothetical protein NDU88_002079 [Pleurodeles waltl]|uniref:Uncharacterized protein n=1 Tax=Pleurodeles waltl TaxID=8319 RepID=A0AAV7TJL7_PLEWA|nr:hypothetical protein NDU88_002079 [Pleurodeles waltl]